MNDFLMFYAPFITLFLSIGIAFVIASKDKAVRQQVEEEE